MWEAALLKGVEYWTRIMYYFEQDNFLQLNKKKAEILYKKNKT